MMDKLLMHYSKKWLDREEHKERDRQERKERVKSRIPHPRVHQPADGVREHSNKETPHPERVTSLPPELASPKAKPKAPVRSMSMQPEMTRGNVHPMMPDFDELAERIKALKNARDATRMSFCMVSVVSGTITCET